jgi:HEAT repeat protein
MKPGTRRTQVRKTALPAIVRALQSDAVPVKRSAVVALSEAGDASTVPILLDLMFSGGELTADARTSLEAMDGEAVDLALINVMQTTEGSGRRRTLIDILNNRRALSAIPAFLAEVRGDDKSVRRNAMTALGRLAGPDHVADMIQGLWKTEGGDRDHAERAITGVCQRISDGNDQAGPVMAVYVDSDDSQKNGLLPLLGRIGSPDALKAIRKALTDGDPDRYQAGVRGIANWPDSTVAEDLLHIAETGRGEAERITALRALARVVVRRGELREKEQLEFLTRGMQLAIRKEERKLILDRAKAIRRIEALQFVVPYLDQPELAEQACRSIVELARDTGFRNRHKEEFRAAILKVTQTTKDRGLAAKAQSRLPE